MRHGHRPPTLRQNVARPTMSQGDIPMHLYSYYRSSATFRVRIALKLKGLDYDTIPIHLVRDGGEQFRADYRALNPQCLVPALADEGGLMTQSLAICEYLDERYPEPPLLPVDLHGRARVRSIALAIACEIHPLNNLRVLAYLTNELGRSEEEKQAWYTHWVRGGLEQLEARLARDADTGSFCHGDTPSLADCFVVPQLYNARRFGVSTEGLTTLLRIDEACKALPAFREAAPENQPDAG